MGESKRRREARQQFEAQQPHKRLGDAPIEAKYHQKMTAIAAAIDEFFNGEAKGDARTVGFVLMVFPFDNREGRCNYLSNGADRKDVVTLMKEMIARFEGQPEIEGQA